MFYTDVLQVYAAIPYNEIHKNLTRRFHAWYKTFKSKSTAVEISAEDAEVGDVVEVAGAGEAAATALPTMRVTLSQVQLDVSRHSMRRSGGCTAERSRPGRACGG
jgi:hypothetical protein